MSGVETEIELLLKDTSNKYIDAETKEKLLNRECELLINEVGARFPKKATTKYDRGIEMILTSVILTAVTTKAIELLFQYIKNRIRSGYQKDYSYEMVLKKGGESKSFRFIASNFTEEEIHKITESIKKFIGEKGLA